MANYFHVLASHAASNRLAIIDPLQSSSSPPKQYTYAELLSRVTVFHEHLVKAALEAGEQLAGARIGLLAPPGVDFIAAVLSIWSVKATVVTMCRTHPLPEMRYTVTDSGQRFIVYHSEYRSQIEPLLEGRIGIDVAKIPKDEKPKKEIDYATLEWPGDTPSTIIYTSGTTGPPKGAVQVAKGAEHGYRSLSKAWQMTPEDRVLHVLPLHHGHGLSLSLLLPLWVGATVEFMSKFDERLVWQRWVDTSLPPITVFMAVPTVWVKMIAYFNQHLKQDVVAAEKAKNAAASLRLAISGSAALPSPIRTAWADISNGYLLLERYGMTETSIIYTGHLGPGGRILGSVGWPAPGVQTRLIADDGRDVSNIPDTIGEIQVKTSSLIQEYWRKPGALEKEFTPDGWFKTGDMALIKAEYNNATFMQGRASVDIIKSGGYKISALDIEAEMLQLPFVQEVAVVGVDDLTWGQMVAALCIPVEGRANELTVENVREKLRSKLASYKLPQILQVVDSLPRNAMGKVQKKVALKQYFPPPRSSKL